MNHCACHKSSLSAADGKYIAHKFESGWEVGVIKAYDKADALSFF